MGKPGTGCILDLTAPPGKHWHRHFLVFHSPTDGNLLTSVFFELISWNSSEKATLDRDLTIKGRVSNKQGVSSLAQKPLRVSAFVFLLQPFSVVRLAVKFRLGDKAKIVWRADCRSWWLWKKIETMQSWVLKQDRKRGFFFSFKQFPESFSFPFDLIVSRRNWLI